MATQWEHAVACVKSIASSFGLKVEEGDKTSPLYTAVVSEHYFLTWQPSQPEYPWGVSRKVEGRFIYVTHSQNWGTAVTRLFRELTEEVVVALIQAEQLAEECDS